MEPAADNVEVDFRFADTEDAAEIISLVNEAFSVEKGNTGLAFINRDRVNAEEVDACLRGSKGERRWLVLETPHPEERMVSAALICTGSSTPGTGSVEVLAVEPSRQGKGLGTRMMRRAEGILLNFCCRFVKMKVPHWREDVLAWAAKRGYRETGGGVWGELDGEDPKDLTRPTRYVVLTRDLLTDKQVVGTFGDGTARFTAATTAAVARASAAGGSRTALDPVNMKATGEADEVSTRREAVSMEGRGESEARGLAGFLSSVLKGMTDADRDEEDRDGEEDTPPRVAAPVADMVVDMAAAATTSSRSHEVPYPPLPTASCNSSEVSDGAVSRAGLSGILSSSVSGHVGSDLTVVGPTAAISPSRSLPIGDLSKEAMSRSDDEGVAAHDGEGESVEDLLSSLMRALHTDQGRVDFEELIAASSVT